MPPTTSSTRPPAATNQPGWAQRGDWQDSDSTERRSSGNSQACAETERRFSNRRYAECGAVGLPQPGASDSENWQRVVRCRNSKARGRLEICVGSALTETARVGERSASSAENEGRRKSSDFLLHFIYWSDMGTRLTLPMRPIHRRSKFVPGLSGLFLPWTDMFDNCMRYREDGRS